MVIRDDLKKGLKPCCVVSTFGTTATTSIYPINEISKICQKYCIWMHVDAAYAGSALILQEYRNRVKGIENADSIVINPHK